MSTEKPTENPYGVVGIIDLTKIPGTSPEICLRILVQRAQNELSVSACGRGVYLQDNSKLERRRIVGCRPPKSDTPVGYTPLFTLNVYDKEVLEILTNALSSY